MKKENNYWAQNMLCRRLQFQKFEDSWMQSVCSLSSLYLLNYLSITCLQNTQYIY